MRAHSFGAIMPLFSYTLTRGTETRTTELRRSNPQGWLLDAVRATFPDIASRRDGDVMRLRLEPVAGAQRTWLATLDDQPGDLQVYVVQTRR